MKGIMFKEDLFEKVVMNRKTETRRLKKSKKPRFEVGEKVFLKEPYFIASNNDVFYKYINQAGDLFPWKNKMFMGAEHARFYIEITDVRSDRVGNIKVAEILAEGIDVYNPAGCTYYARLRREFRRIWDEINGEGSFYSDPEVWVYEFKLVENG